MGSSLFFSIGVVVEAVPLFGGDWTVRRGTATTTFLVVASIFDSLVANAIGAVVVITIENTSKMDNKIISRLSTALAL